MFSWRQKNAGDSNLAEIKFIPNLVVTRNDGWVNLKLMLRNHSNWMEWVEEATIVLTDLDANWQTGVPTGQAIHKIRQNVVPGDVLSVSLAPSTYDAAGGPQGPYSCVVFTNVRYRVHNEWSDGQLETCRVEMKALIVLSLLIPHWYNRKLKQIKSSVDFTTQQRKG
jgi:hypothetical protein